MCVLPWETEQAVTLWLGHQVREYMATANPSSSRPLPEYEPMADVLRIAISRDDFFTIRSGALDEQGNEKARARHAAVANGTWGRPRRMVSNLIEEKLALAVGSEQLKDKT